MPHEYVPWSEGRDFDGVLGGEAWESGQSKMSDVARTSLIVNLLTEDNLPSYHHEIATVFGRDGAWGTWVHQWTAEEGRHGDRDPRLPAGDPRRRPGRAGAGPDDAHGRRLRVGQPRRPAALACLRLVPGAGDPHLAPQHRQDHRATRSPTSCSPASRWTRTCTCSSTATCSARRSQRRAEPDDARHHRGREELRDARQHASRTSPASRCRSRSPGIYDLRIHRDDVLAPGAARTGASSTSRASTRRARRRATSWPTFLDGLDKAAARFEEKRDTHHAKLLARGHEPETI